MSNLNHYAISAILHSEIVGPVGFGHGQIGSQGDVQRYFDALGSSPRTNVADENEEIDWELVKRAFLAVRRDRGSSDLYIADPAKNAIFLKKCRELGIAANDYRINKALFKARKNKELPNLKSVKTSIPYGDFAFASEFAATELRYKTGASVDDILCDPRLASQFDAIAKKVKPGYTSFQYRWAALSIRKRAGRTNTLKAPFVMPKLITGFRLLRDPIEELPEKTGVYLLYEKTKLLYASTTDQLRRGIDSHRSPETLAAIADKLWKPNLDDFLVDFGIIAKPTSNYRHEIERRLVTERHPVFNIPRSGSVA